MDASEEEDEDEEGLDSVCLLDSSCLADDVDGSAFFSSFGGSELEGEAVLGGDISLGISIADKSSPSSAKTAITCPTGIFEEPASDYSFISSSLSWTVCSTLR